MLIAGKVRMGVAFIPRRRHFEFSVCRNLCVNAITYRMLHDFLLLECLPISASRYLIPTFSISFCITDDKA